MSRRHKHTLLPRTIYFLLPLFALALDAPAANAQAIQVVVPNAVASVEGDYSLSTLNNADARTYQTQIAASQLTGFGVGGQIAGISLRVNNNRNAPTRDLRFASYQVVLSQATNTIANFSTTFATNIGANAATVYDSTLTFTAASYSTGATGTTPNAFGPTINFSSPYTYQGGDLVITVRHSGNGVETPFFDATLGSAQGLGTAIVGQYSTAGQNATTSELRDGATVLRLNGTAAAAAPEPGSIALLLSAGVPVVGIVRRRKSK